MREAFERDAHIVAARELATASRNGTMAAKGFVSVPRGAGRGPRVRSHGIYERCAEVVKNDYRDCVRISDNSCILRRWRKRKAAVPRAAIRTKSPRATRPPAPRACSSRSAADSFRKNRCSHRRSQFHDLAGPRPRSNSSLHRSQAATSISQVSVRTALSRAAVRRCLYTLKQLGFADSDDGRHFYLRPRILSLGHSYVSSMPIASSVQPVLEHASRQLHESSSIATLDGLEIIYVARASVTRIMSIDLGVGSRLPAFCTSMGRVLLASLSPKSWKPLSRASNSSITRTAPSQAPRNSAKFCV